jgi:hypothetical protein
MTYGFSWIPPLWYSWLEIQSSRIRFSTLRDFLRSSGSGTGSTQPREYNWGATRKENSSSGLQSQEYGRREPFCWPRNLYQQKLALTSLTSGGRSVGSVCSRTKVTVVYGFSRGLRFIFVIFWVVNVQYGRYTSTRLHGVITQKTIICIEWRCLGIKRRGGIFGCVRG